MPRRVPASGRKHKTKLQVKRAIKRGDVPSPAILAASSTLTKGKNRRPGPGRSLQFGNTEERQENARRLQSSFVKLSAEFLEETRVKAATLPLPRPIPLENAYYQSQSLQSPTGKLTILGRPKWNYEMNKKQVESNEEGLFKRWIEETDQILQDWTASHNAPKETRSSEDVGSESVHEAPVEGESSLADAKMPIAPPQYERNLEVWRQLWRVAEICEILLVLLDSRCPLLHYPVTFQQYLSTFKYPRKVIFVLTKTDISGPARSKAWSTYLSTHYPENPVVLAESYREKLVPAAPGQGQRKHFEPYLPPGLRTDLVRALKVAHEELSTPPSAILNDEAKLRAWRPRVKQNINWDLVISADSFPTNVEETNSEEVGDHVAAAGDDKAPTSNFLSIGLIGQPNVGKSSLLNALFGANKVRSSKTPGKTKHFQTLFWTKDIRLVDCPGLVFPNFVSLELQVMAGILPVSQVSAIPSCVYHASLCIPLEETLRLKLPSETGDPIVEDKRTWRTGQTRNIKAREVSWTAMDIMTAYALSKGWVTAKAAWPDVNRAGNAILRAIADGKVKWSFLPSPSGDAGSSGHTPDVEFGPLEGQGVWISKGIEQSSTWDTDDSSRASVGEDTDSTFSDFSEAEDLEQDPPDAVEKSSRATGMFAALTVEDDIESQGEEE